MYAYIYMHAHIYTYVYIYMHTHMYIYIYIYIFTHFLGRREHLGNLACICRGICTSRICRNSGCSAKCGKLLDKYCNPSKRLKRFGYSFGQLRAGSNSTYIHTFVIYIYIYIYIYVCVSVCVCVCVGPHTCVYIYIYTYVYTYIGMYVCMYVYVCAVLETNEQACGWPQYSGGRS